MANDIANLPTDLAARLLSGIAQSRATTVIPGGKPILRMLKSGEWVFGQESAEVEAGSKWAVNIVSLAHGWICWTDGAGRNKLGGEVMVSMMEAKPAKPAPLDGFDFKEQRTFELKCLTGEDVGTEVIHKATALGSIKAIDGLLAQIQQQLVADPAHPCPVVTFGKDHYEHGQYGRIYTPVFTVAGWCDMSGNMAQEVPALPADGWPGPAAPAPAPAAPQPQPAPTAQLHTGQRRRPAAR